MAGRVAREFQAGRLVMLARNQISRIQRARYISSSIPRVKTAPRRFYASPAQPLPTQITTLDNKIRVATEATPGHFSAVGVYIDAGSRYEAPQYSGVSHILDRMAFKVSEKQRFCRAKLLLQHIYHKTPPLIPTLTLVFYFLRAIIADEKLVEHKRTFRRINVYGN